jgi:hypothetical protein
MHASRGFTFLPVDTVNSVTTLKDGCLTLATPSFTDDDVIGTGACMGPTTTNTTTFPWRRARASALPTPNANPSTGTVHGSVSDQSSLEDAIGSLEC